MIRVSDDIERLPRATQEERTMLRVFDPERSFLGRQVRRP
jgi:hypothetical protein